jgi:enoyl-CoA hydratase/carnithine racemase
MKLVRGAVLQMMIIAMLSGLGWAEPVVLDGLIEPSLVVNVGSSVPGILKTVDVERGDMVKKGQMLARLRSGVEKATMELANKLAKKSPLALQMGKEAFYGMSDLEQGKALEYSNEMFAALCATEDAKEGVDAFLNKRKPEWKER